MKRSTLFLSILCVGFSAQAKPGCASCKGPRTTRRVVQKAPAAVTKKPAPVAKSPAKVIAKTPIQAAKVVAKAPIQTVKAVAKTPAKAPAKMPASGNRIVLQSAADYDAIVNKHPRVVTLFSTTWCGPCQKLKPEFEALIKEMSDVVFVHVDGDKFNRLGTKHNVTGFPTIKIYKDGRHVGDMVGGDTKAGMRNTINQKTR